MAAVNMDPGSETTIEWGVAGCSLAGQTVSGDMHVVEFFEGGVLLGVIDGLGHGSEARLAAETAAAILISNAGEPVVSLVKLCHEALAKTRGVVMTLASVDIVANMVSWMGVGNVEARLFRAEANRRAGGEQILLRSGVVGLQMPAAQATQTPVARGDLLLFATDGIRADFEAGVNPAEFPQQIADGILSRNFKGTDDALVLAVRYTGLWP